MASRDTGKIGRFGQIRDFKRIFEVEISDMCVDSWDGAGLNFQAVREMSISFRLALVHIF